MGKAYTALVSSPTVPFDPIAHAREDLEVFRMHFAQVDSECGIIQLECRYPIGGIMSLPRWCIISVDFGDGLIEVARGEIVQFPFALAGDLVQIEVMCRDQHHTSLVDDLYDALDSTIPVELEAADAKRRAEAYILDVVYHDPRTLRPSLVPIAGDQPPVRTYYGEGATAGTSNVFGLKASMISSPAKSVTMTISASWQQKEYGDINIAERFPKSHPDQSLTLTPDAMRKALSSIQLDGGYSMLSASLDAIPSQPRISWWITKPETDPWSCITVYPDYRQVRTHIINSIDVRAEVVAVQERTETLEITVRPQIADIGSAEDVRETLEAVNVERLIEESRTVSYPARPDKPHLINQVTRWGVGDTLFRGPLGMIRPPAQKIVAAAIGRAARIAIQRAHCIEIIINVAARDAVEITLRDRIRVYDRRLPGGYAVGRVYGLEWTLSSRGEAGKIILRCPVSTSGDRDSADVIGGDEITTNTPIFNTPVILAVRTGDAQYLTTDLQVHDFASEQREAMGIDPAHPTPPAEMQPPDDPDDDVVSDEPYPVEGLWPPLKDPTTTTISVDLRDLSPRDIEDMPVLRLALSDVIVSLPAGVST